MSAFAGALQSLASPPKAQGFLGGDLLEDERLSDYLLATDRQSHADPATKWLLIALVISVFLNGYFMRVISVTAATKTPMGISSANHLPGFKFGSGKTHRKQSSMPSVPSAHQLRKNAPIHIDIPAVKPILSNVVFESPVQVTTTDMVLSPAPSASFDTRSRASTLVNNSPAATDLEYSRTYEECLAIFETKGGIKQLSDEEVILLCKKGKIAAYALEKALGDHTRAVKIRRSVLCKYAPSS